ncbi:uncharacterized protein LOC144044835 [Vanacampus margaritifer]
MCYVSSLASVPMGCCRMSFFLLLLGKLTSLTALVPLGLLSLRPLQWWLLHFRLYPLLDRRKRLRVSSQFMGALASWGHRSVLSTGVPLRVVPSRHEVVTTDASLSRWSAVWHLGAVHLALIHFLLFVAGRHVLVRSDNPSTVYPINHHGGTRSAQLLRASRRLLRLAAPRIASLRAIFLPGIVNQSADSLSRRSPLQWDWRLHLQVVSTIWSRFGKATVDLFASEESTHCPLWFSSEQPARPRCSGTPLAKGPAICLSTSPPHSSDPSEGPSGGSHIVAGGPSLASPDLVPSPLQSAPPNRRSCPVGWIYCPNSRLRFGSICVSGREGSRPECSSSVQHTILNARAPSTC